MTAVVLRPMTVDDIPAAKLIEEMAYSQPWSAHVFAEELELDNRRYLLAEIDGEVVGYAGVMLLGSEAHITTVVVHPRHRKEGLGSRLVLEVIEAAIAGGATSLTLEVRKSNDTAQALYRRFGLAPVGVRKQYYKDEDALIMWAHDIDGLVYRRRLDGIREELA